MTDFSEIKATLVQAMQQVDTDNTYALRKQFDAMLNTLPHGMTAGEQEQFFLTLVSEFWDVEPDEVYSLGVLEDILQDPDVMEILVNGLNGIWYEKHGKLQKADVSFNTNAEIMRVIHNIATPVGRVVNESHPIVDIRLADGSRVNIVIPPISLTGPTLTIRKKTKMRFSWDDLIGFGSLTKDMRQIIEACVQGRLNVVVSGGTGSGKTTILNALTEFIQDNERVITVEEYGDLDIKLPHIIKLEARPANLEGRGEVSQTQLIENAMKMRPDRIIMSEVRGAEIWGIITAMSTGHDGSMFAIHADSALDALSRMETMAATANPGVPILQVRGRLASAIDVIIQQTRLPDGKRKIVSMTEVQGVRNGVIELREFYRFEQTGYDNRRIVGQAAPTGEKPAFLSRLHAMGIDLPENLFEHE